MALKDWKRKTYHLSNNIVEEWENNNNINRKILVIEKYKGDKTYYIWLNSNGYSETLRLAKTKSDAIKFAKRYMKEGFW